MFHWSVGLIWIKRQWRIGWYSLLDSYRTFDKVFLKIELHKLSSQRQINIIN